MELVTAAPRWRPPVDRGPWCWPPTSADQTRAVAGALAPLCAPGDVVLLVGDLGAGKTAFAQGFGPGLGITEADHQPHLHPGPPVPGRRAGPPAQPASTPTSTGSTTSSEIVDLGLGELVEDGAWPWSSGGTRPSPSSGTGSLTVELAAGRRRR